MNKLDLAMKKIMRLIDIQEASDRREQAREILMLLDEFKKDRKKHADEVTEKILDAPIV